MLNLQSKKGTIGSSNLIIQTKNQTFFYLLNFMLTDQKIDINIIESILEQAFKTKNIIVKKLGIKNDYLQIILEGDIPPNKAVCIQCISNQLKKLNIDTKVKVYGKEKTEDFPEWVENIVIEKTQHNISELARHGNLEAIVELIDDELDIENINVKAAWKNDCLQLILVTPQEINKDLANQIKNNIFNLNIEKCNKLKVISQQIDDDFPDWMQEFEKEQINSLVKTINESAQITQNKENKLSIWDSFTQSIAEVGENAANAITWASNSVGETVLKATDGVGFLYETIQNSDQFNNLMKKFNVDLLIKIIDQVDIVKAETEVQQLKSKYPHEQSSEIAHRIITSKAMYSGSSGLASSLIPGFAAAMFTVDLAANMLLQAEMVYQIACAYGLDIQDSTRKGEILAIFGVSLGGSQILKSGSQYALKAGLGFLRNIPAAGAVIGASTNALMIYSLGYGACRFYEAKASIITVEATLENIQEESNSYLEKAIDQEVIMDQILVHVALAGNPNKNRQWIIKELKKINLSPASLETITKNINSPPSLDYLLGKLNEDFAIALLAQCQKVANLDEIINPEEARIIAKVAKKINSD